MKSFTTVAMTLIRVRAMRKQVSTLFAAAALAGAQRPAEREHDRSKSLLGALTPSSDYHMASDPRASVTAGRRGRGKHLCLQPVMSFDDRIKSVTRHIAEELAQAARPAHLDLLRDFTRPQSEIGA